MLLSRIFYLRIERNVCIYKEYFIYLSKLVYYTKLIKLKRAYMYHYMFGSRKFQMSDILHFLEKKNLS